jgi:putative FmdB family regulatory protein
MPFYEYECSNCGYRDEVLQKISDKPLTKCPSCGKNSLKKLISAPVFRLKGAGWYETDFKSDKENKRNLAGAERDDKKSESAESTKDAANKPADAKAPDSKAQESKASDTRPAEKSGEPRSTGARKPAKAVAKKSSRKAAPKRGRK